MGVWLDNIIPVWTNPAALKIDSCALYRGYFPPFLKNAVYQKSLDGQAGLRRGPPDKIEHNRQRTEGFARPIVAEGTEQPILNRVVFRSPGWVVADHDHQSKAINQLGLELLFPEPEGEMEHAASRMRKAASAR